MNTYIFSAAMSVDLNGLFGTLGSETGDDVKANKGIKSLVKIYKALFRIPENLDHYSESDYRTAERRFLKYALEQRKIEMEKAPLGE
jgi:hypothetical protein